MSAPPVEDDPPAPGLLDRLVGLALPLVPRPLIWTVARRYVAGERLEDALQRIEALRAEGFGVILDVLGEHVHEEAEAEAATEEYLRAVTALDRVGVDCPISLKPTHIGLLVDPALCQRNLERLCTAAAASGRRVRFEMEDSPTVEQTLEIFAAVRRRHANVGCVLQSRLFRSADDAARLLELAAPLDVRLVKGIYIEPAAIAWTRDADISRSYVELTQRLAAGGAFLGLATHDAGLATACLEAMAGEGVQPGGGRYEFQLLMGVRKDVAQSLRDAGHPVRIYVPYGPDWHAYSMRRLQRNPAIARQIMGALFRRRG